jgi:hypothetical protein
MKTTKQRTLGTAIALGFLTCTAVAFAGAKSTNAVTETATYVTGSIGTARASADANQLIGCNSYGNEGYCFAEDASGNWKQCFWGTATQAAAVSSITPMSNITFYYDSAGNCTSLEIGNYSYFPPSVP